MKAFRVLAIIAIAWSTSACDSVLGNDDDNFSFDAEVIAFTSGMTDEAEIFAGMRSFQVQGIFIKPSPCHDIKGDVQRNAAQVDIIITSTATVTGTGCPAVIEPMEYFLQTFSVGRGVVRVRVFHQVSGQDRRLITQADINVG